MPSLATRNVWPDETSDEDGIHPVIERFEGEVYDKVAMPLLLTSDPMTTPSRILLYYDGSREARSALSSAADLALALDAHIDVLAIAGTDLATAFGGDLSEQAFIEIRQMTVAVLEEALDHMTSSGVPVHGHVAYGDVLGNISKHVGLLDADMLVVGHRTRGRLARWLGRRFTYADLVERCHGRLVVTIPCD